MKWKRINWYWLENGEHYCNVPHESILISNGKDVYYIEEHGWDKHEYYFHNGNGKVEGMTHFCLLPNPPKENDNADN